MLLTGKWTTKGVHTVEEFDPDPYMDALDKYGLPAARSTTSRCWSTDMKFTELPTPCYLLR